MIVKKIIAGSLAVAVITSPVFGAESCSQLPAHELERHFVIEQEGSCILGRSAESLLGDNMEYLGETYHEIYGVIKAYQTADRLHGYILVEDDLAASLEDANEAIPFIVSIVAIDLGILSAWMLTDMYSRK